MIVGTSNIDLSKLKSAVLNGEDIVDYSNSLVPVWARHIKGIESNQRYYVAITLRGMSSIPYKMRKPYIDRLIDGITLSGVANNVCTIYDILNMCNKDKLIESLKRGRNYEQKQEEKEKCT